MTSNLEGICPKCGAHYFGWALNKPSDRKCEKCGAALDVYKDGIHISSTQSSIDETSFGYQEGTSELNQNTIKKESQSPEDYGEKK